MTRLSTLAEADFNAWKDPLLVSLCAVPQAGVLRRLVLVFIACYHKDASML